MGGEAHGVLGGVGRAGEGAYSLTTDAAPTRSVPLRSSAASGMRAVPIWSSEVPSHTST